MGRHNYVTLVKLLYDSFRIVRIIQTDSKYIRMKSSRSPLSYQVPASKESNMLKPEINLDRLPPAFNVHAHTTMFAGYNVCCSENK